MFLALGRSAAHLGRPTQKLSRTPPEPHCLQPNDKEVRRVNEPVHDRCLQGWPCRKHIRRRSSCREFPSGKRVGPMAIPYPDVELPTYCPCLISVVSHEPVRPIPMTDVCATFTRLPPSYRMRRTLTYRRGLPRATNGQVYRIPRTEPNLSSADRLSLAEHIQILSSPDELQMPAQKREQPNSSRGWRLPLGNRLNQYSFRSFLRSCSRKF